MKSTPATQPPQQAQAEEQPQEKVIVLHFWEMRSRGLIDITHQYALRSRGDVDAYVHEHEYRQMMDLVSGVVELYDSGAPSASMLPRYLVIATISNPGEPRYVVVIMVESPELLLQFTRDDNMLRCPPLVPMMLSKFHGIKL